MAPLPIANNQGIPSVNQSYNDFSSAFRTWREDTFTQWIDGARSYQESVK